MARAIARRMQDITSSEVRELLRITQHPEIISFAGGLPAPELFPTADLAVLAQRVLEENGERALQYSTTEGDAQLRTWIARHMTESWGATYEPDEVLITTGSQQGLDLTAKLFIDEGDVVVTESPTYLAALGAFRICRPRFVALPNDDQGPSVEALERVIREHRPKMVYVVPTGQNPSGRTWPSVRRRAFMDAAARHDVTVIDDNAYSDLFLDESWEPSLRSFDRAEQVVTLGTFSKILSPGLRVGWIAAPRPLLERYVQLKQSADLHTCTLSQMLIRSWLESGKFPASLAATRRLYRERRDAMLAALDEWMPSSVRFTRPRAGLFVWLEFPTWVDTKALLELALARQVAFVPGAGFYAHRECRNTARVNFSAMPPERIREGVKRLADALRELESAPAKTAESVVSA